MILLHRITPIAIGLTSFATFAFLIFSPSVGFKALLPLGCMLVLLHARLLLWEYRRTAFWIFLGTPMTLWVSGMIFFFFLEGAIGAWIIAFGVSLLLALYAENCFSFYHMPSAYQAYALENLSVVFFVASAFFLTSGAFGAQLFLSLPMWISIILISIFIFCATSAVFWVSKVAFETAKPYAFIGAILLTELFVALSLLPTSFVTNAGIFALVLYAYMWCARAFVLERLSKKTLMQVCVFTCVLLIVILATARWV